MRKLGIRVVIPVITSILILGIMFSTETNSFIPTAEGQQNATICNGSISGVIEGDVVVPPGTFCSLNNVVIKGDVIVLSNSLLLDVFPENIIEGNVIGSEADLIRLSNTRVKGNVIGDDNNSVQLSGITVDGNIRLIGGGNGFFSLTMNVSRPITYDSSLKYSPLFRLASKYSSSALDDSGVRNVVSS